MTPSARIQATLELLTEIDRLSRTADGITSDYFRSRRFIGSKDRASVATMLYGILRHQAQLQWWVNQSGGEDQPRTRLIAYMALVEGKVPPQIDALFTGKKFAPATLTDGEQTLTKKLKGHTIDHPSMPEDVQAECPAWAAKPLRQRFGKHFAREMKAMLRPAPLDLRVNP